jgi:hypothetical protein
MTYLKNIQNKVLDAFTAIGEISKEIEDRASIIATGAKGKTTLREELSKRAPEEKIRIFGQDFVIVDRKEQPHVVYWYDREDMQEQDTPRCVTYIRIRNLIEAISGEYENKTYADVLQEVTLEPIYHINFKWLDDSSHIINFVVKMEFCHEYGDDTASVLYEHK